MPRLTRRSLASRGPLRCLFGRISNASAISTENAPTLVRAVDRLANETTQHAGTTGGPRCGGIWTTAVRLGRSADRTDRPLCDRQTGPVGQGYCHLPVRAQHASLDKALASLVDTNRAGGGKACGCCAGNVERVVVEKQHPLGWYGQ